MGNIFSEIIGGISDIIGASPPPQDGTTTSDYFNRHLPDDRNIAQEIAGDVLSGVSMVGDIVVDSIPTNFREVAADVTNTMIAEPIGIVFPAARDRIKDYTNRSWGTGNYSEMEPTGNWAQHLKRWEEDWFKGPSPDEPAYYYNDDKQSKSPAISPSIVDQVSRATERVFDSRPVKVKPKSPDKSKPSKKRSVRKKAGSRQTKRKPKVTVR
jgi:hypothetical protein